MREIKASVELEELCRTIPHVFRKIKCWYWGREDIGRHVNSRDISRGSEVRARLGHRSLTARTIASSMCSGACYRCRET